MMPYLLQHVYCNHSSTRGSQSPAKYRHRRSLLNEWARKCFTVRLSTVLGG